MEYSDYDLRYMKERALSKILVGKKVAKMTKADFDKLPEYSTSMPTGVFVGKRWKSNLKWRKANEPAEWIMREYQEIPGNADSLSTGEWKIEIIEAY